VITDAVFLLESVRINAFSSTAAVCSEIIEGATRVGS
jgi:hypothetical protein